MAQILMLVMALVATIGVAIVNISPYYRKDVPLGMRFIAMLFFVSIWIGFLITL